MAVVVKTQWKQLIFFPIGLGFTTVCQKTHHGAKLEVAYWAISILQISIDNETELVIV